jgi:hypothetical protein
VEKVKSQKEDANKLRKNFVFIGGASNERSQGAALLGEIFSQRR